ncbi:MAG: LysR family transcriptional regulator, partial [Myxococcota bacterium]
HRGIEGARLTPIGRALVTSARTMEDGALGFIATARGKADELSGRVRFAAPPGVAVDLLPVFAAELQAKHAGLRIEARGEVGHVDLARGEADVAVRTREPREPELHEVGSLFATLGIYVSESYLRTLPACPELDQLRWVGWAPPHEGVPPESWVRGQVSDYQPVFVANSFMAQQRAMANGIGAMLLPDVHAYAMPDRPIRLTLDPGLEGRLPQIRVFVVVAKSAWVSPRVRSVATQFLEWLTALEAEASFKMNRSQP